MIKDGERCALFIQLKTAAWRGGGGARGSARTRGENSRVPQARIWWGNCMYAEDMGYASITIHA